jgi:hypothetical protein
MSRTVKAGFLAGMAVATAKVVWERPWRTEVAPSERLDAWVPEAQFRDTIVVTGVQATPAQVFQAFEEVTPADMPLATWLAQLRYLPARLSGNMPRVVEQRPFIAQLLETSRNLVLEFWPGEEVIIGSVGRFHNPMDQQTVTLADPEAFRAFGQPGYQKLAMSLRALSDERESGLTVVLEHRTLALDEEARQRFALYWLGIKPGGALVSWMLLQAVKARAEGASEVAVA